MSTLMQKVESLTIKVRILEEKCSLNVQAQGTERKSYAEMMDESKKVLNQVEKLTERLSNQERILSIPSIETKSYAEMMDESKKVLNQVTEMLSKKREFIKGIQH